MSAASPIIAEGVRRKILVASPRAEFRRHVLKSMVPDTFAAEEAAGGADALLKLGENDFRTLLLDPRLDDLDVDELVETIRTRHPAVNVVVLDRESPSEQLSLELPQDSTDNEETEAPAQEIVDGYPVADEEPRSAEYLPEEPQRASGEESAFAEPLPDMIGTSRTMQQICRLARLVAPRNTAVLIVGATWRAESTRSAAGAVVRSWW